MNEKEILREFVVSDSLSDGNGKPYENACGLLRELKQVETIDKLEDLLSRRVVLCDGDVCSDLYEQNEDAILELYTSLRTTAAVRLIFIYSAEDVTAMEEKDRMALEEMDELLDRTIFLIENKREDIVEALEEYPLRIQGSEQKKQFEKLLTEDIRKYSGLRETVKRMKKEFDIVNSRKPEEFMKWTRVLYSQDREYSLCKQKHVIYNSFAIMTREKKSVFQIVLSGLGDILMSSLLPSEIFGATMEKIGERKLTSVEKTMARVMFLMTKKKLAMSEDTGGQIISLMRDRMRGANIETSDIDMEFSKERLDYIRLYNEVEQGITDIENIPLQYRTKDMCIAAMHHSVNAFKYIEREDMNAEIINIAVSTDGELLKYVPSEFVSQDLALTAVRNNGMALRYVPGEVITDDILHVACFADPMALKFVPKGKRTAELCNMAVNSKVEAIKFVPEDIVDSKMVWNILHVNPLLFKDLPKEFQNTANAVTAMSVSPIALDAIPGEIKCCDEFIRECSIRGFNLKK